MKTSSGLRPARSLGDLGEKRAFDIKVGYGRKRIPPLGTGVPLPKARVVTVYRNGDAYFPGIKVSLRPGKDFFDLPGFCEYLSHRLKIPQGVRHVFDLQGRSIGSLEQLADGGGYVGSGTRTFKEADYGKLARLKTGPVRPNAAPLPRDDMLLFRPHHHDNARRHTSSVASESPEGLSLPGSRESCVVTVVNRIEPARRSRVLLNLKTRQPWEEVLKDMGQAVGMREAKRMITPWGEEVRSFSHLKNDFSEVETFYLDRGATGKSVPHRSNSDPELIVNGRKNLLRVKIPENSSNRWMV